MIEHIVEDIRGFHEAETGRTLEIFFDRTDIGWGQDLRSAISDSVENATFFIPIVTARYFQSAYCRDELLSFYGKCQALGVTELILPIVLAGSSQIREDSDDQLMRIVARIRYMDWSEVWQSGRGSPAWNIAVTRLVQRLVELQQRVEVHLTQTLVQSITESPEVVDGMHRHSGPAAIEELDRVDEDGRIVLHDIGDVVDKMAALLTELAQDLGRIEVADDCQVRSAFDRVGVRYSARGHDVVQNARLALEELVEYDARVRATIRAARQLANREQLGEQVTGLRESALSLGESIRRVDAMSDVLRRYSDINLSLRVALSPTRAGVQTIRDIAHILDGWLSLEL